MDPLRWAKFFARTKHGDQMYGSLPYTHHLAAVEGVLRRFGCEPGCGDYEGYEPEALLEAAWLHDIIEDTRDTPNETKAKDIEEMFGEGVAHLVTAVTDEDGPNRKIRKALTYPKIRNAGPQAVRLKLADRIANAENGGKLVEMYRKEHEDFRRALYTPGENEDMWKYLNELLAK